MKFKLSCAAAFIAAATLIPVVADAHAIYFAQRAKQLALIYGVGADDLDTVKRMPLIESVGAFDADYKPITATARAAGPIVLLDTEEPPTLAVAVLQNGIWSRMEGGEFEKKTLEEMPGAKISEKNIKYTVSILGPLTKEIPALPTQTLQIVPVGPIPDLLGKPMKYKVLFNGKPQAGVEMWNDLINDPDAKPLKTGADGTITMPIRNQGLNVIRAVFVGPTDDPKKYRHIEHTATLSITLAHLPE